jgi:aryl-alcohol dehydrogenase-like predicted oxidoreductase
MENYAGPRKLGRTELMVGRLGVSGGYGAPAEAFALAFERGCNYFYHGSRRSAGMNQAIRDLVARGQREKMVIVAQLYTRSMWHFRRSFDAFRRKTGLDSVDILLLGWYNSMPNERTMALCAELKERGAYRFLAVSGHHRPAFPKMAASGRFDVLHVRYNAAHRGAETDVFPHLPAPRPGIVTYTATRWGQLIKPKRIPPNYSTPRASDCYRFVLSNPNIDVCMTGPKDLAQMKEALNAIDRGPLTPDEMDWMQKVGEHVHRQKTFLPF